MDRVRDLVESFLIESSIIRPALVRTASVSFGGSNPSSRDLVGCAPPCLHLPARDDGFPGRCLWHFLLDNLLLGSAGDRRLNSDFCRLVGVSPTFSLLGSVSPRYPRSRSESHPTSSPTVYISSGWVFPNSGYTCTIPDPISR